MYLFLQKALTKYGCVNFRDFPMSLLSEGELLSGFYGIPVCPIFKIFKHNHHQNLDLIHSLSPVCQCA